MKKILFVLPSLSIGGMERMQVSLANALIKVGYLVTVLTLDADHTLATDLNSGVILLNKPYKTHFGRHIPWIGNRYYDDGMWETRATPEELHRYYVGNEYFDVEIAFFRGLSVKIVSGCKNPKTKTIAWVHNDFRRAKGYANNFKTISDVYDAYASFKHVVCVSKEAQKGFKDVIGDTNNLITIYNILPIDVILEKAQCQPSINVHKENLHVVLVGRLQDTAKGQKRLIHVVTQLHNEGKSISLALIGGGSDEQMLRNEISIGNADEYITMCGNQMNPYPFIREADLLVCASYYEGYNLTVAEALMLGVPVLSTDCTGPTEILDGGKYGVIVDNSEDGLYLGLKDLIEKEGYLEEMRIKASGRVSFFDEESTIAQIVTLFEEE